MPSTLICCSATIVVEPVSRRGSPMPKVPPWPSTNRTSAPPLVETGLPQSQPPTVIEAPGPAASAVKEPPDEMRPSRIIVAAKVRAELVSRKTLPEFVVMLPTLPPEWNSIKAEFVPLALSLTLPDVVVMAP